MSQDVQYEPTPQTAGLQIETNESEEDQYPCGRPIEVLSGSTGTTHDPAGTVPRPPDPPLTTRA